MKFDENDKLIGFEGECINSTNKNMYRRSYANRQRNRDNVILIGDNMGDIHMSDGDTNSEFGSRLMYDGDESTIHVIDETESL